MSTKDFTANVISASKVVPDGNFKDSKASGIWDINEALDLIKGGNWPNVANINPAAFVDGLFQTHLYTGTGSSNTITNNINLSGRGGLVWFKQRNATRDHGLFDTARGQGKYLVANDTNVEATTTTMLTAFNSNGFTLGGGGAIVNNGSGTYVSWTFRKQPKFFDIVTWTGNGTENRTISHNLGSVPGMIIVKGYSLAEDWNVYHRGIGNAKYLQLNSTAAAVAVDTGAGGANLWMSTDPTSTTFKIDEHDRVNKNGDTYVAYLFAHHDDDGGFGEPGDQDIIKCGSYTGNNNDTGPVVNVGFEPQLLMIKRASGGTGNWDVFDNMRGVATGVGEKGLDWNSSDAESNMGANRIDFTSTGFNVFSTSGDTNAADPYIYMAIRRGGMQTPTAASDVFSIDTIGSGAPFFDSNHIVDMALVKSAGASGAWYNYARLMGEKYLATNTKAAEADASEAGFDFMNGHIDSNWGGTDAHSWMWARARGYFDVVTYTATGSAGLTVNHNLGVVPEMMWVKSRSHGGNFYDWAVYHKDLGNTKYLFLNTNAAAAANDEYWNDTSPTSSVFSLGGASTRTNESGKTYIAHLFATAAGVSKVGSYTANGNAQNIDCGFSGGNGARFVLIKRYDAGGHWFQFDTERGFVTGDDFNLQLNETNAEESGYDHIDPLEAGFTVAAYDDDDSPYVNINGATYIFYAIA